MWFRTRALSRFGLFTKFATQAGPGDRDFRFSAPARTASLVKHHCCAARAAYYSTAKSVNRELKFQAADHTHLDQESFSLALDDHMGSASRPESRQGRVMQLSEDAARILHFKCADEMHAHISTDRKTPSNFINKVSSGALLHVSSIEAQRPKPPRVCHITIAHFANDQSQNSMAPFLCCANPISALVIAALA